MRGLIILFSLIACSFFLHGQEEVPAVNNKKNTLGVGIYSGPVSAILNLQLRYERQFADRWSAYSSVDLSITGEPRFQAGVFYDVIRNEKRSALLRLGAGPTHRRKENIIWPDENENIPSHIISETSIEFSLQFQYYLSPRHSLFTQLSNAQYIRESRYGNASQYFISSVYLGYNYHF
ncbi:MAG: hypothetical protein GVX96_01295 [Bacteroidetes bacterium]|jgi:hypothetical protein|nr:hypothetical protein [Bacteroidota bacterium]